MYSSVFVEMSNYVKSQGVLPSSYHESEIVDIPKCFYAHWSGEEGQAKEDMIVMENLIPLGFVFISHGDISSNKLHVDLVIREISKGGINLFYLRKKRKKFSLFSDDWNYMNSPLVSRHKLLYELRRAGHFEGQIFCVKEWQHLPSGHLSGTSLVLTGWWKVVEYFQATNRTVTPVMAGLAELIKVTPEYCQYYHWFVQLAKVFSSEGSHDND